MPLYEWRCRSCGTTSNSFTYGEIPTCGLCASQMTRQYSFYVKSPFIPHFNPSVGAYVSSQADFDDRLRHLSDAQSIRTGIEHNYISVEQGDSQAFGANDEGMESFHRIRHDDADTIAPESLV